MSGGMNYGRLGIKTLSGAIISAPVPADKLVLDPQSFIQDADIVKLTAGKVVKLDATAKGVKLCDGADADETPIGFLVNDMAGYYMQNMQDLASGQTAVLVGNGNMFVTDNVKEDSIAVGDVLYVTTDGVMTKTKGTNTTKIGISYSANSSTNKYILVQSLI